jgi:mannitol-1-phosphate 5-dehydrogenase
MQPAPRTFVGFGFGPIQAGLFLYEAFRSGNFNRLVAAEVLPEVVAAVRRAGGSYRVNIATRTGIEVREVRGVEIFNPCEPADASRLAQALAQAAEVCTALPSVEFFAKGNPSVAALLRAAARRKAASPDLPACVVYTAENHNHAAEILRALCEEGLNDQDRAALAAKTQFLNTVIGKMSGVVTGAAPLKEEGLAPLMDGADRAFLVEEFNRILISRITLPGFQRGLHVFLEKPDLLPFEEAKLYGHNAVHALLGYLARRQGCPFISEAAAHPQLITLAQEAFSAESGPALIARHSGLDPLFTPAGFKLYADDLLQRMVNPYLRDRTERVTRDPRRKLAWDDRFIGTMRLALDAGLAPQRFALGAAAALETLGQTDNPDDQLRKLWTDATDQPPGRKAQLIGLIGQARKKLQRADLRVG